MQIPQRNEKLYRQVKAKRIQHHQTNFTIWATREFLVAQTVKNLPAKQETQGQEDLWEEGMVTHFSILAWRIPWTEETGGLQSRWSQTQTQLSN